MVRNASAFGFLGRFWRPLHSTSQVAVALNYSAPWDEGAPSSAA